MMTDLHASDPIHRQLLRLLATVIDPVTARVHPLDVDRVQAHVDVLPLQGLAHVPVPVVQRDHPTPIHSTDEPVARQRVRDPAQVPLRSLLLGPIRPTRVLQLGESFLPAAPSDAGVQLALDPVLFLSRAPQLVTLPAALRAVRAPPFPEFYTTPPAPGGTGGNHITAPPSTPKPIAPTRVDLPPCPRAPGPPPPHTPGSPHVPEALAPPRLRGGTAHRPPTPEQGGPSQHAAPPPNAPEPQRPRPLPAADQEATSASSTSRVSWAAAPRRGRRPPFPPGRVRCAGTIAGGCVRRAGVGLLAPPSRPGSSQSPRRDDPDGVGRRARRQDGAVADQGGGGNRVSNQAHPVHVTASASSGRCAGRGRRLGSTPWSSLPAHNAATWVGARGPAWISLPWGRGMSCQNPQSLTEQLKRQKWLAGLPAEPHVG